jgi:hypothetical protein
MKFLRSGGRDLVSAQLADRAKSILGRLNLGLLVTLLLSSQTTFKPSSSVIIFILQLLFHHLSVVHCHTLFDTRVALPLRFRCDVTKLTPLPSLICNLFTTLHPLSNPITMASTMDYENENGTRYEGTLPSNYFTQLLHDSFVPPCHRDLWLTWSTRR